MCPGLPGTTGLARADVEAEVLVQVRGTVLGEADDPPGPADDVAVVAQGGEQGRAQGAGQVVALLGPVQAVTNERPSP